METYMNVVNTMAINPTIVSLEALIWEFSLLRSILLELKLVEDGNPKGKHLNELEKLVLIRK